MFVCVQVGGKGGGDHVEDCGECAELCSERKPCLSFECSPTEVGDSQLSLFLSVRHFIRD